MTHHWNCAQTGETRDELSSLPGTGLARGSSRAPMNQATGPPWRTGITRLGPKGLSSDPGSTLASQVTSGFALDHWEPPGIAKEME